MMVPFRVAQRVDMSIRGKWMEKVREGKKLGEAIEACTEYMHVKMNYILTPMPTPNTDSGLSRAAINDLIQKEINRQKGRLQRRERSRARDRKGGGGGKKKKGDGKGKDTDKNKNKIKPICNLFNSAEGCKRDKCRFKHLCTKCKKPGCKGAADCTG